ncbi:MAG: hypothetical protein GW946_00870 [Candidatus Pacebacteria bacterium]|nr:hypothetical protein [Candidatus Paceibacterota bacterium]PIR60835.1 MAG: hypothetical protein COU67_00045 [Candidatus Pacebacteria bacterium CG10_big_fil_rev_8_21_14_0_10_44_54]
MLGSQTHPPATYNKHGMTSLGTTTPPKKQKKSFGMRSILTVVGLSLFFIIAISGVLIAQRQSQVKEAVAPNAPASRPSAAEPDNTSISACQKTFSVAFKPGVNTPQAYSCNTDCTDDYQCKSTTDGANICYRPNAGTAESWTSWLNVSDALPAAVKSGHVTSFHTFVRPNGSVAQSVVVSGKLFARTSPANFENWTDFAQISELDSVGSGTLTAFSAFAVPDGSNTYRQHAVKGGQVWTRDGVNGANWTTWKDVTSNFEGVGAGSGVITGFSSSVLPDGKRIKQFLVRNYQLYTRTSDTTRTNWPNFAVDSILSGVGSGDITNVSAFTKPDKSVKQFAVIGGTLYTRDDAGGKCRLSTNPTSAVCKAETVNGEAQCESKLAFKEDGTTTIATNSSVQPGQKIVFRITAVTDELTGGPVTIKDVLPSQLTFVKFTGANAALATYSQTTRTITADLGVLGTANQTADAKKSIDFIATVSTATGDEGKTFTNNGEVITYLSDGSSSDPTCKISLKIGSTPNYSCNQPCTTDTQCQDTTKGGNDLYSCDTTSETCRLTTNPTSTTCEAAVTYACNTPCTDNSQCSAINADWICAADQGNRCRLDTNRGSDSCEAPPKTYTCNASCDNDEQCKSYNVSYKCYNAGGTTGKVCRLATNETNASCNNPSAPPPTPTVGCNATCSTNADCSNPDHICYDTALVGQTAGKVCRLANYVNSSSCTTPSNAAVTYTPSTTTKGGQPVLPAELPQTGPEEWLNWLKAGLITLGVGAALLLLL